MKNHQRNKFHSKYYLNVVLAFLLCFGINLITPSLAMARICDINQILNTCPKNDAAYNKIKTDFWVKRDGITINPDSVFCAEPISQKMSPENFTDELKWLQVLRILYYIDNGQTGHLPWWPNGTLYTYLKTHATGLSIQSDSK